MKKTIIIAVLAFGINVSAQTNVTKDASGWSILNGIYRGPGSVAEEGINLSNGGKIVIYDPQGVNVRSEGGVNINGVNVASNGKISNVANGTSAKDAVNVEQLNTVNNRLSGQVARIDQQVVRLDGQVQRIDGLVAKTDATNARVTANTNAIETLQNTKADKIQVAQDIQHARQQAIRISNEYTDEKISEVNYKVNTEVKRLDDKLDLEIESNRLAQKRLDDKINSNDEKINQRVKDLEIKIDNRFNAVMSYVGNEFAAVNNRIEGLGAMTVALSAAATSSVYNANKPTNLNIATGLYGRATAIAVGMSHFFNSSTKVSVNWSQGSNTKNAVGIGAGFAF